MRYSFITRLEKKMNNQFWGKTKRFLSGIVAAAMAASLFNWVETYRQIKSWWRYWWKWWCLQAMWILYESECWFNVNFGESEDLHDFGDATEITTVDSFEIVISLNNTIHADETGTLLTENMSVFAVEDNISDSTSITDNYWYYCNESASDWYTGAVNGDLLLHILCLKINYFLFVPNLYLFFRYVLIYL